MRLKNLDSPKDLLETAFSRARKKAKLYKKQKTMFYTTKGKEICKIDAVYDYLDLRLMGVVKDFPSINKLDLFYQDLFEFVIDIDKTRISLSRMSSTTRIIKDLRREKVIELKEMGYEQNSTARIKKISNEFFGRVSSLVKKLKKDIVIYNEASKRLQELPSIKSDEELYLLAGFPNVGKSTLLSKVTESKPKIAAYPFTTKGLNVGIFFKKYLPIQIIDTPGLLDRPISRRNKIELKAISAFQHLKGTIIFVVDPLYGIDAQVNLLKELKKLFSDKGFIVVINKTDMVSKEVLKDVQREFKKEYVILEGEGLNNLKEDLMGQ